MFNSLNALQYYISQEDKKASLEYLSRFAAFMRQLLSCGNAPSILLGDEIKLITDYLWLEHSRFDGQFEYTINCPALTRYWHLPPLLTHGLVESVLYKGVLNPDAGQKGKLTIDFVPGADSLEIIVTDNGKNWIKESSLGKNDEMLQDFEMVMQRINMFNSGQPDPIIIEFTDGLLPGRAFGNRVKLFIPQSIFNPISSNLQSHGHDI